MIDYTMNKQVDLFEYQCYQNCFYSILISRFGMEAKYNLDFTYKYIFKRDDTNSTMPVRLENNNLASFSTLNQKNAIRLFQCDMISQLFDHMDGLLSKEIPVVLSINIRSFNYHPLYNKADFLHGVIIDRKENGRYHIIDHYCFWDFVGWMDADEIKKGVYLSSLKKAYHMPIPDFCLFWIDDSRLGEDSQELVYNFLNKNLNMLVKQIEEENGIIQYLDSLYHLFKSKTDILDLKIVEADLFNLIHDLRLNKEYCIWACEIVDNIEHQALPLFNNQYNLYIKLRKQILKASFQSTANFNSIFDTLLYLIDLENRIYTHLENILL